MRSAILTYHSLDGSGSVISTRPEVFRRQMQSLVARGIPVAPFEDVAGGKQAVALTFDDAYENFADCALPVLEELGLPATVFVVSGRCGGFSDWIGSADVPRLRLMDWSALRSLPPRLISLGSHTVSHPNLALLPAHAIEGELAGSRTELEQRLGRAVISFAYPYGSVNEAVLTAARSAYRFAAGTRLDYRGVRVDAMHLPRIDAYYLRPQHIFDRITSGDGRGYLGLRRFLRELRSGVQGGY